MRNKLLLTCLAVVGMHSLALIGISGRAAGNDTFVHQSGANLHFLKNYSVAIRSERLVVGAPRHGLTGWGWSIPFHVEYQIENVTDSVVHATVGFPLPPCSLDAYISGKFLDFNSGASPTCVKQPTMKLSVDGHAATGGVWDFVFTLDGKLLTETPEASDLMNRARAMIAAVRDPEEAPLFTDNVDYRRNAADLCRRLGGTLTRGACPAFKRMQVYSTFIWKHDFAPHKRTAVVHDYDIEPSVNIRGREAFSFDAFCLADPSVAGAYATYEKHPDASGYVREFFTEYVLRTGALWAAPIENFELIITRSSADQVVSTCFPGLKKDSPLQFSARRKNYAPDADLRILYFSVNAGR